MSYSCNGPKKKRKSGMGKFFDALKFSNSRPFSKISLKTSRDKSETNVLYESKVLCRYCDKICAFEPCE